MEKLESQDIRGIDGNLVDDGSDCLYTRFGNIHCPCEFCIKKEDHCKCKEHQPGFKKEQAIARAEGK
jgi:hypothetical protein